MKKENSYSNNSIIEGVRNKIILMRESYKAL